MPTSLTALAGVYLSEWLPGVRFDPNVSVELKFCSQTRIMGSPLSSTALARDFRGCPCRQLRWPGHAIPGPSLSSTALARAALRQRGSIAQMAHDYVVVFWGGWTGHVRVAIVGSGCLSSTPWLPPGRLSLPLCSIGRAWFDYPRCLACCPWFALRGLEAGFTP